jgi:hypothetical protein
MGSNGLYLNFFVFKKTESNSYRDNKYCRSKRKSIVDCGVVVVVVFVFAVGERGGAILLKQNSKVLDTRESSLKQRAVSI